METLNAFQIGPRHHGSKVKFMHVFSDSLIEGILLDSENSIGGITSALNVDGKTYAVTKLTLVEVA